MQYVARCRGDRSDHDGNGYLFYSLGRVELRRYWRALLSVFDVRYPYSGGEERSAHLLGHSGRILLYLRDLYPHSVRHMSYPGCRIRLLRSAPQARRLAAFRRVPRRRVGRRGCMPDRLRFVEYLDMADGFLLYSRTIGYCESRADRLDRMGALGTALCARRWMARDAHRCVRCQYLHARGGGTAVRETDTLSDLLLHLCCHILFTLLYARFFSFVRLIGADGAIYDLCYVFYISCGWSSVAGQHFGPDHFFGSCFVFHRANRSAALRRRRRATGRGRASDLGIGFADWCCADRHGFGSEPNCHRGGSLLHSHPKSFYFMAV